MPGRCSKLESYHLLTFVLKFPVEFVPVFQKKLGWPIVHLLETHQVVFCCSQIQEGLGPQAPPRTPSIRVSLWLGVARRVC